MDLALIAPDTSPRGANVACESDNWDFGLGAVFYLDATQARWAKNWRVESYTIQELMPLVTGTLPIHAAKVGIFGHSMGGHGALTLALRHPGIFKIRLSLRIHLRAYKMYVGPQGVHRVSGC